MGPQNPKAASIEGSLLHFDLLMDSHCYILFSETLQKFYVGASHEAIDQRLEKHNQHSYGEHRFTAAANDWNLFIEIQALDFAHAVRMERKIKSMKSSKYIGNLKKYPELVDKLKLQTST